MSEKRFNIILFGFFLVILLYGMDLHSQNIGDLRSGLYESYIESLHRGDIKNPSTLNGQDLQNLAFAHYQRAKVYKNIYELMVHSSLRLMDVLAEEAAFMGESPAVKRIDLRISGLSGEWNVLKEDIQNLPKQDEILIEWFLPKNTQFTCNESSQFCNLMTLFNEGTHDDYVNVYELLQKMELQDNSNLLNNLASISDLNKRGDLVIEWLNKIQLQMIGDFILSAWLFDAAGDPSSSGAYFSARKWSEFKSRQGDIHQVINLFNFMGYQIQAQGICVPSEMAESFLTQVKSNNQYLLYTVEAMNSCTSRKKLKNEFESNLISIENKNRTAAQLISNALISTGNYELAKERLAEQISRNDMFRLNSAGSPENLSSLALLNYMIGGDENWREARELLAVLQNEFDGLSPATLVLQLATQSEFRESINIIID